jgi:hypothetical protein
MENKVPLTLSEFRVIHFTPEGFFKLLFGLFFLLLLNSCSKEAALDEVRPASVETTSVLKEWATKNDKLNQAKSIEWDNAIPISFSDSIKGHSAFVRTASGFKEFITFELGGKRNGWYKSYKRLNDTDMEIIIKSIEGKTLTGGFIRKSKTPISKGKIASNKEMNLLEMEIDMIFQYLFGIMLGDVRVSAPSLYQQGGGGGVGRPLYLNYYGYYEGGSGSGGGGDGANINFTSYTYPEITNNLTNDCFNQVLNELKGNNLKGEIACIIELFDDSKKGSGYDFTIDNNYYEEPKSFKINGILYTSTIYGKTVGKNISLNMATLQNASKELIAKTIIHEILHVYLNDSNMQDHIKIASGFVGEMALFLEKSYGMNLQEAKSICASGLAKIPNYELILKTIDSNLTREKVDNTISKFSNTSNTKQYGTYCN